MITNNLKRNNIIKRRGLKLLLELGVLKQSQHEFIDKKPPIQLLKIVKLINSKP